MGRSDYEESSQAQFELNEFEPESSWEQSHYLELGPLGRSTLNTNIKQKETKTNGEGTGTAGANLLRDKISPYRISFCRHTYISILLQCVI